MGKKCRKRGDRKTEDHLQQNNKKQKVRWEDRLISITNGKDVNGPRSLRKIDVEKKKKKKISYKSDFKTRPGGVGRKEANKYSLTNRERKKPGIRRGIERANSGSKKGKNKKILKKSDFSKGGEGLRIALMSI